MCGRFSRAKEFSEIAVRFRFQDIDPSADKLFLNPAYNIAPGAFQTIPVIIRDDRCFLRLMGWGLVPFWGKELKIGQKMINARAETIDSKPAFRESFRERRCLIAADGFYEWQRWGGRKQPYYVTFRDHRPFAYAGLWDRWQRPDGEALESCTILTTESNEVVKPIHDRMPAILNGDHFDSWLDTKAPLAEAKALLEAFRDVDRFPPHRMYELTIERAVGKTFISMEDPEHRVYGAPDLLVRSDVLARLFPGSIQPAEAARTAEMLRRAEARR